MSFCWKEFQQAADSESLVVTMTILRNPFVKLRPTTLMAILMLIGGGGFMAGRATCPLQEVQDCPEAQPRMTVTTMTA